MSSDVDDSFRAEADGPQPPHDRHADGDGDADEPEPQERVDLQPVSQPVSQLISGSMAHRKKQKREHVAVQETERTYARLTALFQNYLGKPVSER